MKTYDRKKPLISIHIPKCAGQSFEHILKQWFGNNIFLHYFNRRENRKPEKYNLKKGIFRKNFKEGICIHGHFNNKRKFGVRDYYPETDQFITVMRDPFEIALSNYFFGKKLRDAHFRDGKLLPMRKQFRNLDDYLDGISSYLLNYMPFDMTEDNYEEILKNNFVYIGIVEDLQASVDVLAERLSFPRVKIGHLNISERNEEVSEEKKQKFISNHPLEYAIYNFALQNYKNRIVGTI